MSAWITPLVVIAVCSLLSGCGSFFGASLASHNSQPAYSSCDVTTDVVAPIGVGWESKSGNTLVAGGVGPKQIRSCFAPRDRDLGVTIVGIKKWRRAQP